MLFSTDTELALELGRRVTVAEDDDVGISPLQLSCQITSIGILHRRAQLNDVVFYAVHHSQI